MSIGELVLDAGVEYFNLHLVNSMEETSVWVKVVSSDSNLIFVHAPKSPTGRSVYVLEYDYKIDVDVRLSVDFKAQEEVLFFYAVQSSITDPERVIAMQKKGCVPKDDLVFKLFVKREQGPQPEGEQPVTVTDEPTTDPQTPPDPRASPFQYTIDFSTDGPVRGHKAKAQAVPERCGRMEGEESTA
ncbi:hypothetical protein DdX_19827 [Ditylenchus destructor]|uniref:Uncharacterized protein n=1 Tax=Ditylenchus destructor TaxID=166010 RepID=A0AAD4QWT0_9BILA|nr:hypothetical protein DdX_19827 [Ditylenchus destructor]